MFETSSYYVLNVVWTKHDYCALMCYAFCVRSAKAFPLSSRTLCPFIELQKTKLPILQTQAKLPHILAAGFMKRFRW